MAALLIDRAVLPEPLLSMFAAPRIAILPRRDTGSVTLEPVIDPGDYDNDTDYLNAIPGMMESIIEGCNTPLSECISREELWD